MPPFELQDLEFTAAVVSEESDESLLDELAESIGSQPPIVRLCGAAPTPGEMQAAIASHLQVKQVPDQPSDAADELRSALAELRRSLG